MVMDIEKKERSAEEYIVEREVLNELRLNEVARKRTYFPKPTLGEQAKEFVRCSVPRVMNILLKWIPVLGWLPHYSFREYAVGDLVSGCSVSIMHLPQGMAYALLAALPPVYGLYSSLFPVLVYFIFGTSRHISIGTFAVISVMIGSVTEELAPDSKFVINGTNGSEIIDIGARDAYRVQIACSLTVLSGIFQILLGVVRFGFVVTYLSEPLVRGYTTGSACHVCVSQLKYLFGVRPARFTGPLALIYTLVDLCRLLLGTHVPELLISLVALFILSVVKEINAYCRQKLPMPIPIELIVVILATLISHFVDLPGKYSISVVGEIPSGLKVPRAPDASVFSQVIGSAFAVAIVGFAICISLGKTFGLKHGYKVDSNQELFALGLSNTIGSFFQCYAVTSSLSRTLVQETTGGKTQVAGMISCVIVLITILKLGALFEDLPKAVLSAIVLVNLKGMFKQFTDVPILWRTNKVDLVVWLVTFTSTILLNLDLGLAVSIAFAMLTVIFRTQLPRYAILGNVPGTDIYLDTDLYQEAKEIPGIKIFRSSTTIYYANVELYLDALQEKSGIDLGKLLTQKKKQETKLKREQDKEKKRLRKEEKKQKKELAKAKKTEVSPELKGPSEGENIDLTENWTSDLKGQVNLAYTHSMSDTDSGMVCQCDESINEELQQIDEEKEIAIIPGTHSIILDISTTSFVDTVTVKSFKNIFRDFAEIDIVIYLTGCQTHVVEQLEAGGFFSDNVPKSRLFATVHDAVLHILQGLEPKDVVLDVCYTTQL
ncbi:solute carrier family 26 member 6-like [Antennarius striatus]|uniref:solute carrier family 26 member 6-like n=1 Tax=Antennarius striatus TaxID=241820 RepID=UPI0035B34324